MLTNRVASLYSETFVKKQANLILPQPEANCGLFNKDGRLVHVCEFVVNKTATDFFEKVQNPK